MKDINTLSGIEFEHLCQALLQKAGFDVETTKASGDGGIDLIARCHQPFFDGKYIIQCKRYSGGVGEPIIRDLYGVVMAEHANKGILMTTGYFSMSAINFSRNKNLELIDGEKLAELLSEHGLVESNQIPQKHHFTQYDCFNLQKYDFFKKMVNQGSCTIEMGHDFLFSFMFDYFVNSKYKANPDVQSMIHSGFAEEYLRLFDWYAGKYYKRGKEKLRKLEQYTDTYKTVAYLYNFDIFEYVKSKYTMLTDDCEFYRIQYHFDNTFDRYGREKHKHFCMGLDWNEPDMQTTKNYIISNLFNESRVKFLAFSWFYELMSLLSLFSYFNIASGVEKINNLLYGEYPELKELVESQKDYQEAFKKVRIFYSYDVWADLQAHDIALVDLTSYFDTFKDVEHEKIESEVAQIEGLLSTLM